MKRFVILIFLLTISITFVLGLKCRNDNNCLILHTTPCQNFTCVDNYCVQFNYICPELQTTSSCFNTKGVCSIIDGKCHYSKSNICQDDNICTQDICKEDGCEYRKIEGCVEDAEHKVMFDIVEQNKLDVEVLDKDNIKICHTTFYRGEESVSLLSFTPYETKTLKQRGTCDNRIKITEIQTPVFPLETVIPGTIYPCVPPQAMPVFDFAIPGFADETFVWTTVPLHPTITFHETSHMLRIQGYVMSTTNPLFIMGVDLHFVEQLDKHAGAPHLGMYATCYKNSQQLNPRSWKYYKSSYGSMFALSGSPYFGLVIDLTESHNLAQMGHGATGVNIEYGVYAEYNWDVISQPYDTFKHVDVFDTKLIFMSNINLNTKKREDGYIDLFEEPQQAPVNGWVSQLLNNGESIQYCRTFTVYDLLGCRNATDPYTMLFNYTHDLTFNRVEYRGVLYATGLVPCGIDEECMTEKVIDKASFNLTFVVDEHGFVDVQHDTTYINVEIVWDNNVWLRGVDAGNIMINFKTKLVHSDMMLTRPTIDAMSERGYPLVFDETVDSQCVLENNECVQSWTLRSYHAQDVINFDGEKTISWEIQRNHVTLQRIHVHMILKAAHVGEQIHADQYDSIMSHLNIFTDRAFTNIYRNEDLTENNPLYGLLCLDKYEHLDIHLKQIDLCYSETADVVPYDPHNAIETGCNTPNINIKKITIYASDEPIDPIWHSFQVTPLYNPPESASCEGFSFLPQVVTPYLQTMQVTWYSQENGGVGGMIELLSEKSHTYTRDIEENEASEHFHYHTHCSLGYVYSPLVHTCILFSERGDDDDEFNEYWHHNDSIDNTWILLLSLSLIMILIICCFTGLIRNLLFKTSLPKRSSRTGKKSR